MDVLLFFEQDCCQECFKNLFLLEKLKCELYKISKDYLFDRDYNSD